MDGQEDDKNFLSFFNMVSHPIFLSVSLAPGFLKNNFHEAPARLDYYPYRWAALDMFCKKIMISLKSSASIRAAVLF